MRSLIPLLVAACCVAPSALAQVQGDPDVIALLMQDAVLKIRRSDAEDGSPMLQSNIDGIDFYVNFYDCAQVCGAVQFTAGFDLDEAMPMEMANLWNRDHRFGKVYLDRSGDPFVENERVVLPRQQHDGISTRGTQIGRQVRWTRAQSRSSTQQ